MSLHGWLQLSGFVQLQMLSFVLIGPQHTSCIQVCAYDDGMDGHACNAR